MGEYVIREEESYDFGVQRSRSLWDFIKEACRHSLYGSMSRLVELLFALSSHFQCRGAKIIPGTAPINTVYKVLI